MPRSQARCPRKPNGSPNDRTPSPRHRLTTTPEPPPPRPPRPPTSPRSSTYGAYTASSTASPLRPNPLSSRERDAIHQDGHSPTRNTPLPAPCTDPQYHEIQARTPGQRHP